MIKKNLNNNIFIENTKWVLKWLFIFAAISCLGLLVFFSYGQYAPKNEILITLECEVVENIAVKFKSHRDFEIPNNLSALSGVKIYASIDNAIDKLILEAEETNPVGSKSVIKIAKGNNSEDPSNVYLLPIDILKSNYSFRFKKLLPTYNFSHFPAGDSLYFSLEESPNIYSFIRILPLIPEKLVYGEEPMLSINHVWTIDRVTLVKTNYFSYATKPFMVENCKEIQASAFDEALVKMVWQYELNLKF